MSPVTKATKAEAEVYYGGETCSEKFALLLAEMGFPGCLMTVLDIQEYGYVKDTGFVVWLLHKKNRENYKFEDTVVSCDAVITAYFQPNKIKNLTGVKTREFLIWINLIEICGEEGDDSLACLSKSFPLSLFGGIKAQKLVFREEVDGSNEGNWCNKLKLLGFSWERVERGFRGGGDTRSYLFW
ncbi:hypothetical protein SLA2020_051180 [Shorea laevis]